MATLATLRSAILRNLDRTGATATEIADVTAWINQFIREIACADHNWPFMRTETATLDTVADQDEYSFPETATGRFKDCDEIYFREASTDEWRPLLETTEKAMLRHFSSQDEGPAQAWAMSGARTFRVAPIPDQIYSNCFRIFTWEYPADLSADGDSNELTLYHSQMIEWAVTARGFLHYGESEQSAQWAQRAEREYSRVLLAERRTGAPSRRTLRISLAAGRPALGLRRWTRAHATEPYDWI